MSNRLFHIFLFLILIFSTQTAVCQLSTIEDQVQHEIIRRGLDENELRALLFDKNIDLDNIQNLSPEQIAELQVSIDELQQITILNEVQGGSDTTDVDIKNELISESQDSLINREDLEMDTLVDGIYGHHLFHDGRVGLINPAQGYRPPVGYVIGAGDELAISFFGRTRREDNKYSVKRDGSVLINDNNIRVFVAGLTIEKAREKLVSSFRRFSSFSNDNFNLSVATVRTINVQIFGEVEAPGNYNASGVNSIFNIIGEAGGFTKNGSVRNIKIIKQSGDIVPFDLYGPLFNPSKSAFAFLEDGDLIHIPALGTIVEMKGAVNRPFKYELTASDDLFDAVEFSGGLARNAYLTAIKIARYDGEKMTLKTVPYAELVRKNQSFNLVDGDIIEVSAIAEELENVVSIEGAVRNPGDFERITDMTLRDLINYGNLKPDARRDFAYLRRTNIDGTNTMIPVSIDDALNSDDPNINIRLLDNDKLTVWELERFTDNKYIKVGGAVRYPETIAFDEGGSLKASHVIEMAGGLRRDAAEFAHVHRVDPLNPNERQYISLDLLRLMSDPNSVDNITLEPFDSLYVYSKNDFLEEVTVRVSGAVGNAGEFAYGSGMTLNEALILAGGFRRSSATNEIEVSRVVIKDNQPTSTIVQKVSLNRADLANFKEQTKVFVLEPFDNIFVRYVPEFELQQNVTITGEVTFPGEYSLQKDNETVYDLIQRAQGLTDEAFPPAARLIRSDDTLAQWIMQLDEVMADPNSRFNYVLKDGDEIDIPKRQDWVAIVGEAQLLVQNPDLPILFAPYHKGENAEFYIDRYAGGFGDNARTDKLFVKYANGQVQSSRRKFPFGKKHPEVLPGSHIQIGQKKLDLNVNKNEENVNWTRVLGDSVAQAMSILTLILLVQRLD